MSKPIVQGPLNRAHIDTVTRQSTDHKQLWETTNTTLANNQGSINSHTAQIAALTARIAALEDKTA
jgi:uncharacterized glyoxalase superfamily metalloenzyme YdcJ